MLKRTLSGLMLLALTALPAAAQARQFLQAPQYLTGANSSPQAIAVGSFKNDGVLDLAVANSGTNNVTIFLGNGDGTFTAGVTYVTGTSPEGIAVGDFNRDGNPDLAVANFGSSTVTILFGNGDGTFTPATSTLATGPKPHGIAVGNFNGYPDIVVTNSATSGVNNSTVGLFLNNGDGTFGPMSPYNTGFSPWAVAVGDFNGDGLLDMAVANNNNSNQISILLALPTGGFQTTGAYTGTPNQGNPVSVAVGNLISGSSNDLAVAVDGNGVADSVVILTPNSSGVFTIAASYPTAKFPSSVAIADLNGDGIPDLAVAAENGNVVTVFWGTGNAANPFEGQANCGTGDIPYAVVTGDFKGDGNIDLATANSSGNSVSVIMNNGNETFQSRLDYAAGNQPHAVATADLIGNGIMDLVQTSLSCPGTPGCNGVSVVLGNGDGTFQPPNYFTTGVDTDPVGVAIGDFNKDGTPDLAVVNYSQTSGGTVSVLLGIPNSNGSFQTHVDYPVGNTNTTEPTSEPTFVAIGDFNGDEYPDLVVTNYYDDNISVLLNKGAGGNGAFAPAVNYNVGHGPIAVAVGDVNGDSKLDLVVVNQTDNNVSVLLGNGDGTFQPQVTYCVVPNQSPCVGGNPLSVAVGSFRNNGIIDLAVADFNTQQVSILLGNGDGTFQKAATYYTCVLNPQKTACAQDANPSSVVIADFNGDGIPDLALTSTPLNSSPGNVVSLLLGNGDGTFGSASLFGAGYVAYSLAAGDFNGDGAPDIAVANSGSNTVSILLNLQGTAITVKPSLAPSTFGQSVTLTATVAASVSNGAAPTGQVTFENGSTLIGTENLVNGAASVSTSALPAATNSLMAIYSGDSNYQPHTVQLSQKVNAATSSVSLTSTPNPSAPNQTATFTASVSSPTTQPGGVVTFLDGSTSIGTGTLNGSGQATLSTSTLATGKHNVTAFYAGNSNITSSTSSALQQVIAVPTAPSFSLTANWSTSNSIAPGATATALVTINPAGGLNPSTVQLKCTVSPSANPAATCQLGAVSVASGVGTATLTFKTAGPTSSLLMPNDNHGSNMLFAVGLMIPALLLGGAGMTKPGRKKFMSFCLCLALAGCVASIACGGGSSGGSSTTTPPPSGNSGTPAGAYQVTVSGSASGVASPSPATLPVTVQ